MRGAVLEESKNDLRRVFLSRRKTHAPAECRAWSRAIQAQAIRLPQYLSAEAVALYSPIENEVETAAIAADARERKKRIFYPKIRGEKEPVFHEVASPRELRAGRFNILEPAAGAPMPRAALQNSIVFVPGVAFDPHGHRIGRGGGWYDRLLGQLAEGAVFVGLAFEFQLVEKLTVERWDQGVHWIITEKRIIGCEPSRL